MKYNLLGNTGLKVSSLCLGTMSYGGKGIFKKIGDLDQADVDEQLKMCVDAGVNFIDTANVYSEGASEEMVGKAIRNLGLNRDDLVLATKVCGMMGAGPNETGLSRKHILQQVDASLKRLNTDYIDLYQMHAFDNLTPLEDALETFDILVKSGKVRYTGASNMAAWQLMKALDYAKYNRVARFASMQVHYSLASRDIEREILPLTIDQKVGTMIWSPLIGGLLTGKYYRDGTSEGGRLDTPGPFPVNKELVFDILDILRPMAADKNASVAQLALAWVMQQQGVSTVIIAANKAANLEDNLKAGEISFTPEEMNLLNDVSKLNVEYPGWILEFALRK